MFLIGNIFNAIQFGPSSAVGVDSMDIIGLDSDVQRPMSSHKTLGTTKTKQLKTQRNTFDDKTA